jgi:hypothetical protein
MHVSVEKIVIEVGEIWQVFAIGSIGLAYAGSWWCLAMAVIAIISRVVKEKLQKPTEVKPS